MLKSGSVLNDRYEIQSVLGEGGMGFVYLALDRVLGGKKVAVKEMAVHIHRDDERAQALRMFRDEAMLLASLEHPRLVPVSDFFEHADNAYLVMAYVDGSTLDEACAQRAVTMVEKLDWIDQICEVLEYLHNHRPPVLFRDLKPSNIMLDSRNQVRLIDFGIARTLEAGSSTATFLKGAGTAEFAPIEQFGGRGTDPRSDIYSLGATMFNLLTGELPPISVDIIAGEAAAVEPRQLNPAIPPDLERVVLKAMALRKEDRYQSVAEVRAAVATARASLSDEPVVPTIGPSSPTVSPHAGAAPVDTLRAAGLESSATIARPQPPVLSTPPPPASFAATAPPSALARAARTALTALGLVALSLGVLLAAGWRPFAGSARLEVTTTPDGAAVIVDGTPRGQTPLVLGGLRGGVHSLHVEKGGLEPQDITFSVDGERIEVRPGYNGKLTGESGPAAQLALSLPPKEGTILVNTDPSGVSVLVDGKKVADNVPNGKRIQVREGAHVLQVRAPGRVPSAPRTVNVAWKSMVVLEETLQVANGALLVDSKPAGAEIAIDGTVRGRTPLKIDVTPGRHSIEVRKPGFDSYTQTLEVAAGGDQPVMALLSASPLARATSPAIVAVPAPSIVAVPAPVVVVAAPASTPAPTPTPQTAVTVARVTPTEAAPEPTPQAADPPRREGAYPGVYAQMLMALDMVHSGRMTKEFVLQKMTDRLQREGTPNVEFRIAQMDRVFTSAQGLGPQEYLGHRQRLANRLTMIALSR